MTSRFLNKFKLPVTLLPALLCLSWGCSTREISQEPIKEENFAEVARKSLLVSRSFLEFKARGPFAVTRKADIQIPFEVSHSVLADLYLSEHLSPAPLLIFIHGNNSYKEAHQVQAEWASSWGFHSLVLQMPEDSQWVANGDTLANVVRFLYAWPNFLGKPFDINKMVLVGHSFGGSAVSLALAQKIPVMGAILLDPAVFNDRIRKSLRAISVPIMVLGADETVFRSKRRSWFRKNISSTYSEFSVAGSTHYDAQSPSQISLKYWGMDLTTTTEYQEIFKAALISSAMSLVQRGDFSFAVSSFTDAVSKGDLLLRANRMSSKRKG